MLQANTENQLKKQDVQRQYKAKAAQTRLGTVDIVSIIARRKAAAVAFGHIVQNG